MIKAAVEKTQLCQIHFYQKIAGKKVARVNAALWCKILIVSDLVHVGKLGTLPPAIF